MRIFFGLLVFILAAGILLFDEISPDEQKSSDLSAFENIVFADIKDQAAKDPNLDKHWSSLKGFKIQSEESSDPNPSQNAPIRYDKIVPTSENGEYLLEIQEVMMDENHLILQMSFFNKETLNKEFELSRTYELKK